MRSRFSCSTENSVVELQSSKSFLMNIRLRLSITLLCFSLSHSFAQSAFRHSADCWLENKSGYGVALTGGSPSTSEILDEIRLLSTAYKVPVEIIAAICYRESGLFQYGTDSFVVHNIAECKYCFAHGTLSSGGSSPPPGIGLMQLTD